MRRRTSGLGDYQRRNGCTAAADPRAAARLDEWVREVVNWHFDPATGSPFWLEFARSSGWDPRREMQGFARSARVSAIRGRVAARRARAALGAEGAGRQADLRVRDGRHDRHSQDAGRVRGLPHRLRAVQRHPARRVLPEGRELADARPSGPRRLRLSVEHLAQYRGGICFCVDLDPRWVIKLIKKGWTEHLEAYKAPRHRPGGDHPAGGARHPVHVHDAEAARIAGAPARVDGDDASGKAGITGIFSGGTEFTPQWTRFAHEELLDGAYMTPTYGNTLMGLAAARPAGPAKATRSPTTRRSRARSIEVVDFDDPNQRRRVRADRAASKLTTLTKEFFVPGFLERDEGEREPPCEAYPWDGISGVRPFRGFAATTTVGVYPDSGAFGHLVNLVH